MKQEKESYEIFYSVNLDKFILICDVTEDNCCFEISEDEFNYIFSKKGIDKLDMIANACAVMGTVSPRYRCSENESKNRTEEHQKFAEILLQEIRNCRKES